MKPLVISEKTIDIEKLIKTKAPKLYRYMPRFILSYFQNLLHEKELNEHLLKYKNHMGIDFAKATLDSMGAICSLHGAENIKEDGRYIVAANHPLGGLDGMALISEIGKIKKDLLFPVNDFLLALPNLRSIFIPVNKLSSNSKNHQALHDAFSSKSTILYFPAGICSRKQKGVIKDPEWKKSFIQQAKNSGREILPVFIAGQNSKRFYKLANLRKKLKIKINLEQILLVDEMYKQKNKKIELIVGTPISPELLGPEISNTEWAQRIKEHVYALEKSPQASFQIRSK